MYGIDKVTMSDGNINMVHHWIPEGEVKGVVVLSHGMTEHAFRYDSFGQLLNEKGYVLYAEDHRGHGETAKLAKESGTGDFGILAEKDGFFRVVDDIHEEIINARKAYPGKKVILFGHSFGSFVSQCCIEKYGCDLDGVVLCGTAGPAGAYVKVGKMVAAINCLFTGRKHISHFMDKASFGSYNNRIENPRTNFDWLSRDSEQVDKYMADPWCGFTCTSGFYKDMTTGLVWIHKKANIAAVPENLPILFIDGTGDPVGGYGKTVEKLYNIYKANGIKNVTLKLYEDARHELFNETNREEIKTDVLLWIDKVIDL